MKPQLLNKILFILLLLLPIHLFAQSVSTAEIDITGLWKGSLYNDTTKKYLPYEIAISEEKGKLSGYSYTLFEIDGKKEIGVKSIKIKRKGDQVTIEDAELISNNYSEPPPRKVRQLSIVNLSVNDTAMILAGNWSTNRTKEYSPLTGKLQLQRAIDYKPLALFKKLEELKLDHDLSFVKSAIKRETEIAIAVILPKSNGSTVSAASTVGDVDKGKESPATRTEKNPVATNTTTESAVKENLLTDKAAAKVLVADKTPAINAPVTEQKTAVAAVSKETKTKNSQPVAEKPKVIVAPAVSNNTAPVAVAKVPVKTDNKPTTTLVIPPDQKKEVPAIVAAPIVPKAAANVAERKMNNEQLINFVSDSLVLTLYDNGDVDGDTVSVLMNGQIIFAKQGLSTKANSKTIYTGKGLPDSLSMVMYAENLGSIPPNTGLMVIMDGEKRYEVRFSADLKTNAAILLRRIKKEK